MNLTAELPSQPSQKSVSTFLNPRIYLLGLGLVFASAGQAVLLMIIPDSKTVGSMQAIAALMLVAGILLFGVSTLHYQFALPRLDLPAQSTTSRFISTGTWSRYVLLIAFDLALSALFFFASQGENPLTIILWLLSILALFASQYRFGHLALPRIKPEERLYWIDLALLLVVTFATRVYHITTLPYNLDGDFADVGLQARALATGQTQHIFAFGWAEIPILGYLPAWLSMKVFGTGLAGLNASGVAEGLLILVGVYLLGRDLFHARVGLLAAALLTVSYTHLAASRQSVYIDPVVFILFALYFLLVGLREDRRWMLIVSGILTALCLQLYYSGRIVLPIMAFVLLLLWVIHRSWLRPRLGLILLWGFAVLVALGPMLLVLTRSPDALISRTRDVFILNQDVVVHMESKDHVFTLPAMLLEQAHRTALLFHYYPDAGTQFGLGVPFLDPVLATLFTLGIGYAFFHWRRLDGILLLSWVGLGVVIGCFLTVNPPFWPRLMILLPPCALLAAIALNLLYELLHRLFIKISGRLAPVAALTIIFLLIGLGWRNWNLYINSKGTYATPRTFIARYLAELPPTGQFHLVSSGFKITDREFEFLAPGRMVDNLSVEQAEEALATNDSSCVMVFSPEEKDIVVRLQEQFPKAVFETHSGNSPDQVAFYVVHLP
jgi:hypothetical protein